MPNGKAPSTGEVFRNPDMAAVLRELGTGGKEAFYGGRIGEAMVEVLQKMGGVLTMEDLKARQFFRKDTIGCASRQQRSFRLLWCSLCSAARRSRRRVYVCGNLIVPTVQDILTNIYCFLHEPG